MTLTDFTWTMSRRTAVAVWITGVGAVHIMLPVALARATRAITVRNQPAVMLLGLVSLGGGVVGLIWALAQHYHGAPDTGYKMALTPEYLLQSGPYRFSRNPMYVAELAMWAGWSLLLANPVVAAGTALLAVGLRHAVRLEEGTIATRFGDEWIEYTTRTPRWLGRAPIKR